MAGLTKEQRKALPKDKKSVERRKVDAERARMYRAAKRKPKKDGFAPSRRAAKAIAEDRVPKAKRLTLRDALSALDEARRDFASAACSLHPMSLAFTRLAGQYQGLHGEISAARRDLERFASSSVAIGELHEMESALRGYRSQLASTVSRLDHLVPTVEMSKGRVRPSRK